MFENLKFNRIENIVPSPVEYTWFLKNLYFSLLEPFISSLSIQLTNIGKAF